MAKKGQQLGPNNKKIYFFDTRSPKNDSKIVKVVSNECL